ncbi:hypothetical protein Tco_0768790 [Tanacetum coccineum]
MPPRRNRDINDIYEQKLEQRIIARIDERFDQFADQFVDRMNDMMNPRRRGDCNIQRSEGEELENSFFKGDGSSLFIEHEEWEDDGMSDDDYEEALVFNDDQYEDVIEEEEGFIDNYLNFQKDETNVSFSGVVLSVEEESMPVYDTDIEDAIEDEEGCVRKRGFSEEEDNMKDVVVMANDLYSSKIQTSTSGMVNLLMIKEDICKFIIRICNGEGQRSYRVQIDWMESQPERWLEKNETT